VFFFKASLTGLVGVSLGMADISGIVTDTGTTPISGAVVQIEKNGQPVTTGSDGRFTLVVGSTGILPDNGKLLQNGLSAGISGNLMTVTIAERSAIEVATFDLSGKALSTVRKTMDAGSHSMSLPYQGAGIYLYKVKSGHSEFVLKGNAVGGISYGSSITSQGLSSHSLAKRAKATAAINGVIAVTKTGYLNHRVVVYNSDTTGIAIKMIASAGTVTDTDGNVYQTVRIGNQEWTVENLRTTKYRDGSPIPFDTSTLTWASTETPKFCYYGNTTDADSIKKYGALYNWHVVDTANPKKIAPSGWHVPNDSEWTVLERYLVINGYNWDGTRDTTVTNKTAKSMAAKADWHTHTAAGSIGSDLTKNNTSGFSALPGGFRRNNCAFGGIGYYGRWWSCSAPALGASLEWDWGHVYYFYDLLRYSYGKSCGWSVRLVKD
jgi:uncharacterized protein (TIGR02145 family)